MTASVVVSNLFRFFRFFRTVPRGMKHEQVPGDRPATSRRAATCRRVAGRNLRLTMANRSPRPAPEETLNWVASPMPTQPGTVNHSQAN